MQDSPAKTVGDAPAPARGWDTVAPRPPASSEPTQARAVLAILRRRLKLLIACVILAPLCAAISLRQMTPHYTASGTLVYEHNEYRLPELQSVSQPAPPNEAAMATQAEILESLHIAQKVAERGNLFANPEFNPALRKPSLPDRITARVARWFVRHDHHADEAAVADPSDATPDIADSAPAQAGRPGTDGQPRDFGPSLSGLPMGSQRDGSPIPIDEANATIRGVKAALQARAVRYSHAIEVTFTAEDPLVAAAAVNNAMDVYIKDQFSVKARAARRARETLERGSDELRAQVQRGEERIAAYRAEQRLSQGMHAGLDAEHISHLTEDLVRARSELANAEARLDAARGRAGAGAQAAIAPSVVQLRAQQEQAEAQIQAQLLRFGPAHPAAVALRRQMAEANRAVAMETSRVVAAIEAERRSAAERVASLERDLRAAQAEADRTGRAQTTLNAMVREVEAWRTQLQLNLADIQKLAQQSAAETAEAHEISQALPPEYPSSPKTTLFMAAAALGGVFVGLLLVYLTHLLDTTLHSGEDARAAANLPCFALLPEVGRAVLRRVRMEDYVVRRPLTAFAEQVRALRAALWFGANRPRVIAITSARPAEGKTILTVSLGRSAALAGERVLLVECDTRQPKVARLLPSTTPCGLSDLLKGAATQEEVVQRDKLSGLDFIHAGRLYPGQLGGDMFALFMSEAMGRLLASSRQHYDLVILDAPPVQAMTEARVAAAIADATLMCVRWRSTPSGVLRHALELLEDAHAAVVGIVLTRVDPRAHVRSGAADAEVYHRRYRRYQRG